MTELERVDAYCDATPRSAARVEEHGTLRLFVATPESYHPWYARPSGPGPVAPADVAAVRTRCAELQIPFSIEWVEGRSRVPTEGLVVEHLQLLVASPDELLPFEAEIKARIVTDVSVVQRAMAVQHVGFAHPGTSTGAAGVESVAAELQDDPRRTARVALGKPFMAVAFVDGEVVAAGGFGVEGDVAEITGVATLPAYRRKGLGTAVTAVLAQEAVTRGARLLFLSAGSDAVARVYSRLGFREIGLMGSASA